ncbi:MAG: DNA recombination protein RmuC [Bradymonadales bacterium]|nr:MAG: DNA recombination protein RmuC [Bradymonadales bacterium]
MNLWMISFLWGGLGAVVGGLVTFLWTRAKRQSLELQIESERKLGEERLKILQEAKSSLEDSFRSLSSKALENNNEAFLTLAKTQFESFQERSVSQLNEKKNSIQELVKPVKESLDRVDSKIQEIEKSRIQSESSLLKNLELLQSTHQELRTETSSLVAALRTPQTRGRWGEMQLKRVVEMAGMLDHCDFVTQSSENHETGRLRPDLVVHLPGGKKVVVDAKTPLASYLEALESSDPEKRLQKLKDHARHVRKHIEDLSRKSYWSQFQPSPEFVILFLPGESLFGAALEQDPSLIEAGVAQNVILATPTTLIALLRAVSYGWQQESLTENVKSLGQLGQDLYKRVADLGGHLQKLGRNLKQSVDSYNLVVGNVESRVLVTARKMRDQRLIGNEGEIPKLDGLDQIPRQLTAEEFSSKLEIESKLE